MSINFDVSLRYIYRLETKHYASIHPRTFHHHHHYSCHDYLCQSHSRVWSSILPQLHQTNQTLPVSLASSDHDQDCYEDDDNKDGHDYVEDCDEGDSDGDGDYDVEVMIA